MKKTTPDTISTLRNFFSKKENDNWFKAGVNDVDTIDDVLKFKMKSPRRIVYPGDLFLCDIEKNEMWLVRLTDRKDKKRTDAYEIDKIAPIIDHCFKRFHTFNGYWELPKIKIPEELK